MANGSSEVVQINTKKTNMEKESKKQTEKNKLMFPLVIISILLIIYFIGFRIERNKTIELKQQIEILKTTNR